MGRKILAWIGIIVIALWILATAAIAILPVPNKSQIFPIFMFGCIIFPLFLWIAFWIYGAVTGKKNVASFRTEEMEETMRKAEQIRQEMREKQASAETDKAEANTGENKPEA